MDEEGSLESGHESEASPALPAWAWGIPSLLSAVVVVGVLVALSWGQGSPRNLLSLKPNELGDFIAGAAGGLAFVWLTFGYFLQSREIALQRGEIALQRRETARLAQVAGLTEQHARRDTAIRSLELAIPEIYELSHLIFHHSYGSLSEDTRTRNRNVLKPQFDAGDKWI